MPLVDGLDSLSPLARGSAARRVLPCGCGGEGGDCGFWLSDGLASAEARGGRVQGPPHHPAPGELPQGSPAHSALGKMRNTPRQQDLGVSQRTPVHS